jgi:Glycosyl transferase family 2
MDIGCLHFIERVLGQCPRPAKALILGSNSLTRIVRSRLASSGLGSADIVTHPLSDSAAESGLGDCLYDLIVAPSTLEHMKDPLGTLTSCYRRLKSTGALIVTASTFPQDPHSPIDAGPPRHDEFYRNIDPYQIDALLKTLQFGAWRIETYPQGRMHLIATMPEAILDYEPVSLYAVIVTLNGLSHTQRLECALREVPMPLRLVVVDNGSADGTREWLHSLHMMDQVCIANERNIGVAASWNLGIRMAAANGATAVLLCGNDTLPHPGTVERLAEHIRNGVPVITGTECAYDAPGVQVPLATPYDWLVGGPDYSFLMLSMAAVNALTAVELKEPSGSPNIGLFDTTFHPGYFEDSDYTVRLACARIPILRDPQALFGHARSLTMRSNPAISDQLVAVAKDNHSVFRLKWGFSPFKVKAASDRPDWMPEDIWSTIAHPELTRVRVDAAAQRALPTAGGPRYRHGLGRVSTPSSARS